MRWFELAAARYARSDRGKAVLRPVAAPSDHGMWVSPYFPSATELGK